MPHENQRLPGSIVADTAAAPPGDQFELFRSWYAGLADIKSQFAAGPFLARQSAWSFGRLTLTHLSTSAVSYTWQSVRNPPIDSWCVHLTLPHLRQQSDPGIVGLSLRSLAEPFEGRSEQSDHIALFVPRNLQVAQSSAMVLRDQARQLLVEYLVLLCHALPGLGGGDMAHIDAATTSLLAACLAPSRDHAVEARRPIEAAIMSRASRIIGERLADPALTPDLICREIGVSRSRLYRIFEPIGGISTYIRRERLRKTRNALENSIDQRAISSIAEQWGFWDPSTYSRMFKKEFGVSPSDARAGGVRGFLPGRPTSASTLRDLLFSNY
jgi:AraC-like DNA-binding protein